MASFALPDSVVNAANLSAPHRFRLTSVLGTTRFYAVGSDSPLGKVELNPMGVGGDFIAFPVVGDMAFTASANGKARFSNVELHHYRRPSNLIRTVVADTVVSGAVVAAWYAGADTPIRPTLFPSEVS